MPELPEHAAKTGLINRFVEANPGQSAQSMARDATDEEQGAAPEGSSRQEGYIEEVVPGSDLTMGMSTPDGRDYLWPEATVLPRSTPASDADLAPLVLKGAIPRPRKLYLDFTVAILCVRTFKSRPIPFISALKFSILRQVHLLTHTMPQILNPSQWLVLKSLPKSKRRFRVSFAIILTDWVLVFTSLDMLTWVRQ